MLIQMHRLNTNKLMTILIKAFETIIKCKELLLTFYFAILLSKFDTHRQLHKTKAKLNVLCSLPSGSFIFRAAIPCIYYKNKCVGSKVSQSETERVHNGFVYIWFLALFSCKYLHHCHHILENLTILYLIYGFRVRKRERWAWKSLRDDDCIVKKTFPWEN